MLLISQPLLTVAFSWLSLLRPRAWSCFALYLFFLPGIRLGARVLGTDLVPFYATVLLLYPFVGFAWDMMQFARSPVIKTLALGLAAVSVALLLVDLDVRWGSRTDMVSWHLSAGEIIAINGVYGLLSIWLSLSAQRVRFREGARAGALARELAQCAHRHRSTVRMSVLSCTLLNLLMLIPDSGWDIPMWYMAFLPVALGFHWAGITNPSMAPSPLWEVLATVCSLGLYAAVGFVGDRLRTSLRGRGRFIGLAALAAVYGFFTACFYFSGPRVLPDHGGPEVLRREGLIGAQVMVTIALGLLAVTERLRGTRPAGSVPTTKEAIECSSRRGTSKS